MAIAVDYREFTPRNSRDDLIRKVEQAPVEHAEAVLAAYDLLQRLHEKGMIDLLNGLLSAGDTVVERVVDVVSSKEMVTALRIALIFSNLLSSIDPDKLHAVISNAGKDAPSLLAIGKQAASKDARRGMAAAVGLLNVFGEALNAQQAGRAKRARYFMDGCHGRNYRAIDIGKRSRFLNVMAERVTGFTSQTAEETLAVEEPLEIQLGYGKAEDER